MKELFERYIELKLNHLAADYIELNSGTVHREIGGYPSSHHQMPLCCQVMYDFMKGDDAIISSPPKGKGASLTIRYYKRNH